MGNNASKTMEVGGVTYGVERVLGKGAYGKVHVLFPPKGHPDQVPRLALKRMDKQLILSKGPRTLKALLFERLILSKMRHPFLVNLHATMQNEDELFMVLDLMHGGDLSYWLHRNHSLPEGQVRFYAANILLSLRYFHKHGVLHRDIKPENIMLDNKGYAHLTDLNVCKPINLETGTVTGFAGSAVYMAPEIFRQEPYDTRADMWSLGVMLYELLVGRLPWHKAPRASTDEYIKKTKLPTDWVKRAPNDPEYTRMVKRITREKIHFPSTVFPPGNMKDFLEHLICPVDSRYTVEDALRHPWFADINLDEMLNRTLPAPFVPDSEVANADAHFVFEEVMGPKPKRKLLTDEEQAQFHSWDWLSDEVLSAKKTAEKDLPPPKKGKSSAKRSTLMKSTDDCQQRQAAYIAAPPAEPDGDLIFEFMPDSRSAPLRSVEPVVRYQHPHSKRKHSASVKGTNSAASSSDGVISSPPSTSAPVLPSEAHSKPASDSQPKRSASESTPQTPSSTSSSDSS